MLQIFTNYYIWKFIPDLLFFGKMNKLYKVTNMQSLKVEHKKWFIVNSNLESNLLYIQYEKTLLYKQNTKKATIYALKKLE